MNIPKTNSVSIFRGMNFVFLEDGNEIIVVGSTFSGKESVFLNGELVSEKRSVQKASKHSFRKDDKEYVISFNVPEMLKGKVECYLYINGNLIKRYRTCFRQQFDKRIFVLFLIIGIPFGMLLKSHTLPLWTVAPFILIIYVSGLLLKMNQLQIEEF